MTTSLLLGTPMGCTPRGLLKKFHHNLESSEQKLTLTSFKHLFEI